MPPAPALYTVTESLRRTIPLGGFSVRETGRQGQLPIIPFYRDMVTFATLVIATTENRPTQDFHRRTQDEKPALLRLDAVFFGGEVCRDQGAVFLRGDDRDGCARFQQASVRDNDPGDGRLGVNHDERFAF